MTKDGARELIMAAYAGQYQTVLALLKSGVSQDAADKDGVTALAWAASGGWIEVVNLLLEHGADTSIKDRRGRTALQLANFKGHIMVVRLLNEAPSRSTHVQEEPSPSPIHYATESAQQLMEAAATGDAERVRHLLESGSNPNAKRKGITVFGAAAQNGHNHIVELMLDYGTDVNVKDDSGATALAWAALAGKIEVVKKLINEGATIDAEASDGLTPVARAITREETEAVKVLLTHGADPNGLMTISSVTMSLLGYAIWQEQLIIAESLISFGADINNKSYPPLIFFAAAGVISAMEFLVARGADVTIKNNSGATALVFSALLGNITAVRLLLENGAEIEKADRIEAAGVAEAKGHDEIVYLIKNFVYHPPLVASGAPSPARRSNEAQSYGRGAPARDVENLVNDLNTLVGLDGVKTDVTQLVNFLKFQQMRKAKGLSTPQQSLHMVFIGNPGTGKTTIARLIAQVYNSLGVLSKGQFIETDRAGLVGGYLGQTAIKTQAIVESAIGGVLFIDEAYSLTDNTHGHDQYGQEAVATLLKLMEDYRDDLIVIVAGYTEPMQKFIRSNPGLQSRFNKFLHFDDYALAELTEIFRHFAASGDYKLHPATELKLTNVFAALHARRDETFGNARLARNLFEKAINAHANRIVSAGAMDEASLVTLYPEDIPNA